MIDLLTLHKQFLAPHIKPGDQVADFTMGNGHDTLWLCRAVGEKGHVWAFDIQKQAVNSTRALLESELGYVNYDLILASHADAGKYVAGKIKAGVFNLGYLPGGDKSITTLRSSTLPAVRGAVEMLAPDGIVLIAVYPGHEEGKLEGEALSEMLAGYSRFQYCVSCFRLLNSPTSPFFYMVESK
ncbi:MAG: hypothetical protein IJR90_03810 [Clostridia bacterium]|nr:hypothetical protein [Clostridia bacterium]